jgi:hypothetical protein
LWTGAEDGFNARCRRLHRTGLDAFLNRFQGREMKTTAMLVAVLLLSGDSTIARAQAQEPAATGSPPAAPRR